jgi:curli biogenesis system outer membrane secretion channel CsgG
MLPICFWIGGPKVPRRFLKIGLLLTVLALAACSQNAAAPPTATRAAPTRTAVPPTATPVVGAATMGFTAEGLPFKGNANSPVTLWEFSEFQ